MNSKDEQARLDRVSELVEAARSAGADAADAICVTGRSQSVSVREGKVENSEAAESDDVSLRVFVEGRIASVGATRGYDPLRLAERAVAMARVAPIDESRSLADPKRLTGTTVDLDLFDESWPDADSMVATALEMETAAGAVDGVSQIMGAGVSCSRSGLTLVTSGGFSGSYRGSHFSRSIAALAGTGQSMERDYDFSSSRHLNDLRQPEEIGRHAGERAVRRLGGRKMPTGPVTVIFDPRVARGLAGTMGQLINGSAVVRKTSFWRDLMGQAVAANGITLTDDPQRVRGPGSRPFDGEGVRGEPMTMIENGILRNWFLSTSTARELGLQTNGRGARSGAQVLPSSTNLAIEAGDISPEDMISGLDHGLYVTEVIGQGVNLVTGDYSRGASGFRIENGELTHPVTEVTIAANLKDMFRRMLAANDLDRSFATAAPTLLVEGMTLAGE
ncbi:TldD/PmbA family protein [Notoacmeibacter sp. MSK16QG-6]|uniref:TldD/PmbA family protein n=1 Tax=Notoacmeibacter sp. MSK16QG-6 TaxID=2957982 RepID=UPI0020A0519C|nr:TldD/PmbA family protein [Notoacmeibacter sp. MSK16QG-6]MCP1198500.1 TldD/PmbA family protein [Notoacmeibacter sp. MSK16QG-6]